MQIELPATLVIRSQGKELKPVLKLEQIGSRKHVLYLDPGTTTNYRNLLEAIAEEFAPKPQLEPVGPGDEDDDED